jgi:hypothetical protein
MSTAALHLSLLLPIIFALHNIEEYYSFEKFQQTYLRNINQFITASAFLYSIIMLNIIVVVLVYTNYFFSSQFTELLTLVIGSALFLNGFQHVIGSLILRKILPGFITSCVFILPLTILFILTARTNILIQFKSFYTYILISIVVMYISIVISLVFGDSMSRLIKVLA